MKKTIMTFIALCMCAVLFLAACGQSESTSGQGAAAPQTQAGDAAPAADAQAPAQAQDDTDDGQAAAGTNPAVNWEDMAEIEFYTFCFVPPSDVQHVEDAINAITEEAINTHVHMTVLDIGAYIQQIGVMMAGGERIDVMLSGFATASFTAMMSQHQLMDITDLIDTYGPDIIPTVGDLIQGCMSDGRIYATPTYRNLNTSSYIVMRKDVLEDLGLVEQAEAIDSMSDYAAILEAVHNSEKWSYLHPCQTGNGNGPINTGILVADAFADADLFDSLGDQIGVIHSDDKGHVSLLQENEQYAGAAAFLRDAESKGLIYMDVSGETTSMEDLIRDDMIFSFMSQTEFGAEVSYAQKCMRDVVVINAGTNKLTAENIVKFSFEVPITAEEPEAAVAFLNLCYTNKELNNLLAWGVEGVDYEVVNGVAKYIEGNENPAFHMFDYSVPNGFLVTPWDGQTADFYERAKKDMDDNCVLSPYVGFVPNLDDVSTEQAAVSSVYNEYNLQIRSGQASEQTYQDFIAKLKASGVDKLIAAYQEQLDAWMASK